MTLQCDRAGSRGSRFLQMKPSTFFSANTYRQTLKKEYNKSGRRCHILTVFLPWVMLDILWDNHTLEEPARAWTESVASAC